jgi:hypothetical protein
MASLRILRQEAAAARPLSLRIRAYVRLLPLLFLLFVNAPVSSKEAVIFEQIGQLAGVTAYLHVHIELSITSVEQQLSKYRQLLITKLGTEESIRTFMLSQYDPDPKPPVSPGSNDPKVNQSNSAAYVIMLWKKIAALHL